jgi:TolB-like protein/DNA-binding winged helix-turn-helix (wHTH) protein/Tfp pilus assembly protein PilF
MNESLEAVPDCLQILDWRFHVAAHRLERDGETVRLEPRVAGLLLYLARRAGQPVSRTALLEALWPGVVVSDEALTNAINKLRRAFGDDRANPQVIETIPKAGYRLIAPVQPVAAAVGEPPARATACVDTAGRIRRRWLVPMAALVLVAGLVALFATYREPGREPAGTAPSGQQIAGTVKPRPALAVLPFDNLGPDPAGEYYVDGITDDVITRLAKNPGLMVISRDSSFFYKGKSLDPRLVAEKLGVDYVLRGSMRREGDVLKLNAWLVDATSGAHVWAEHYERTPGQVFAIQDEMNRDIITALAAPLAEHTADTTTANPQAYDNLLLGRHHFYKFENRGENLKARAFFEEAVRLDPGFATAHAMLAWTYAFAAMNGWTDDRPGALQQAGRIASRALEIQPALPLAYYVRGLSYREQHEYVKALVEAQAAIQYDPNYANAHVLLATLLYYAGRPEEGLARIREAMQINPHHPYNYHFHLGQAYFVLRRYREAIDAFNLGLASNPASERMRVWLAAALAQSGDLESAKWESEQIRAADPGFSLQRMTQTFPFKNPADLEHFLDGLRLAGLQ